MSINSITGFLDAYDYFYSVTLCPLYRVQFTVIFRIVWKDQSAVAFHPAIFRKLWNVQSDVAFHAVIFLELWNVQSDVACHAAVFHSLYYTFHLQVFHKVLKSHFKVHQCIQPVYNCYN